MQPTTHSTFCTICDVDASVIVSATSSGSTPRTASTSSPCSAVAPCCGSAARSSDTPMSAAAVADVSSNGPALIGMITALAFLAALRSGAQGGPLALEAPDVAYVMLSPVDRTRALLRPVTQRVRSAAYLAATSGAIVGQLAGRRLPGYPGGMGGKRRLVRHHHGDPVGGHGARRPRHSPAVVDGHGDRHGRRGMARCRSGLARAGPGQHVRQPCPVGVPTAPDRPRRNAGGGDRVDRRGQSRCTRHHSTRLPDAAASLPSCGSR